MTSSSTSSAVSTRPKGRNRKGGPFPVTQRASPEVGAALGRSKESAGRRVRLVVVSNGADSIDDPSEIRPQTRADCEQGPRPCPYVSCRFNLFLDVTADGHLKRNYGHIEPDEMTVSCALDLADDGPRTLDAVASLLGVTKERARQIEASALNRMADSLGIHRGGSTDVEALGAAGDLDLDLDGSGSPERDDRLIWL